MKRAAIILAVVVAIVAIIVAAIPFVVPGSFLKDLVAGRIAAVTGRAVTFSGQPSLTIYPQIAISIDGLSVANPQGMSHDPFLTADSLHTRLRLLPLLMGRVEFEAFELTRPIIHLVRDGQGRANWLMSGALSAEAAKPAADPAAAEPEDVALGRLAAVNGTILYDDVATSWHEEMTEVDLDIDWPSMSATASGRGKVMWRGEPMEFTGLIAAPLQLMRGGISAVRFALASTPLRISFSGRAQGTGELHLDGDATVSTPSLRRTIEWLGTPMGTGPILGAASIQGSVDAGGPELHFSSATIELDGNTAQGYLGARFAAPRPSVTGALAGGRLDLSPYIEAIQADLAASGSWVLAPARLAFAEAVDTDLSVSADQVIMGGTEAGKTHARITTKDGQISIAVNNAAFHGGNVSATVEAGRDGDAFAGRAEVTAEDVRVNPVLNELAGVTALAGTTSTTFELSARGRIWGEFANALAGSGTLAVTDGSLDGIDLEGLAMRLADPNATPVAGGSGTTKFSRLAASVKVANGELSADDLTMTGDDFRLLLGGHGSVLSQAVAGQATLTTRTETVPLTIGGTWGAPLFRRGWTGAGGG